MRIFVMSLLLSVIMTSGWCSTSSDSSSNPGSDEEKYFVPNMRPRNKAKVKIDIPPIEGVITTKDGFEIPYYIENVPPGKPTGNSQVSPEKGEQ